ncbi:MAG: glycosyltransferase family 2 protein, partial [Marinosulfonomonas sp.]|nr:glycosyltransferase family 2 protein [Marinosulfonomonas sp.]
LAFDQALTEFEAEGGVSGRGGRYRANCDLLVAGEGANIFDRACQASTGVIRLLGAQVYPWRIRKGKPAGFGDHICSRFDGGKAHSRWCVAPGKADENIVWRPFRIVGAEANDAEYARFNRHMFLRHPTSSVSKIVPKSSLIEDAALLDGADRIFGHKPVRVPAEKIKKPNTGPAQTTIVTTMKNEGPFILEWVAYHRAIGVSDILVYTNDCTDGTDSLLDVLQDKGFVQHRDNPFRDSGLKPQHAAHKAADQEPVVRDADWLICMDVDEYINIHVGKGRLADLFDAVGQANMIALTWRLFGNGDIHEFSDVPIAQTFTRCAPELARKPHQAWGFKTLYRNLGIFKKLGVHRPKGLKPQLWEDINWVNGSGAPMPPSIFRNGWRSTTSTYGYDLVTLNHYAVRSAESFLVKRDRGRVNHVDRDQGLAYWFRMNNNAEHDASIHRMLPAMQAGLDAMMADPDIAAAHAHCVKMHRAKIEELKGGENYARFYGELTGGRMQRLARMHVHFGANVFLSGPEVVPDEVVDMDPPADFFFTVEKGDTQH